MESQKFAERLRWVIIDHLRMRPTPFAKQANLSPGYISDILKGKRPAPGPEVIQRISSEYGIRYEWLLRGDGEPIAKYSEHSEDWEVNENPQVMKTIRAGPAGAARKMSDEELLREIRDQFHESQRAKPYMKGAYKDMLKAFFTELLERVDAPKP